MQNATKTLLLIVVLPFVLLSSCSETDSETLSGMSFDAYWHQGKAELTRFELQQARYGEIRSGDAVLIFVTEPFLKTKQVKYESGDDSDVTPVLKLNSTRKFYTGIYPYSTMSSIFTSTVPGEPTLKITASIQEWCGQTFMQLNHSDNGYRAELRSYFQQEGDRNFELDSAVLEDELWTRIRIAPAELPTGNVAMIPALLHLRLKHIDMNIEQVQAQLQETRNPALSDAPLYEYTVQYTSIDRKLVINFEKSFPHRILAWQEVYKDGYGPDAEVLTTTAVRTNSMLLDYWSKNSNADDHLREELGLTQ